MKYLKLYKTLYETKQKIVSSPFVGLSKEGGGGDSDNLVYIPTQGDSKLFELDVNRYGKLVYKEKSGDVAGNVILYKSSNKLVETTTLTQKGLHITTTSVFPNGTTLLSHSFDSTINTGQITLSQNIIGLGMRTFYGCSEITEITLPGSITSIASTKGGSMGPFSGCTGITKITFLGTMRQWSEVEKGEDWDISLPSTCRVHCTDGTCELNHKEPNSPLRFLALENTSIGIYKPSSSTISGTYYISPDNQTWTQWDGSDLTLRAGQSIFLKGDNPKGITISTSLKEVFKTGEGKLDCEGNIMSLLGENIYEIPCEHCFFSFFNDCSLISAPELPSKVLTTDCYGDLFSGCKYLISSPDLPATGLKSLCYHGMFSGCTSLINVPLQLPAPKLMSQSYDSMFRNCTHLKTSPRIRLSSEENLQYGLEDMFSGCTNLEYVDIRGITKWPSSGAKNWLSGVSSKGILVVNENLNIPEGPDGIPVGWIAKIPED